MSSRSVQLKAPRMDAALLATTLGMLCLGLVMVLSASGVMAERTMGSQYHYFLRQTAFALGGLGVMSLFAVIPREFLYKFKYVWLVLAAGLICLTVFTPLGVKVNNATRWVRVGPINVQPLEASKLALVVYLAYFFGTKQEFMGSLSKGFGPPLAVSATLAGLLILQPDFGGAAMLMMLFGAMTVVGGVRLYHLVPMALLGAAAGWKLMMSEDYRVDRFYTFIHPEADPLGAGYQVIQSKLAFGSGEIFGVGLGQSMQKLYFLPEAHNDFLMAVLGEELGFVGVSLVFVLVGVILWRGMAIAWAQPELRDRLLAFGCTTLLALGFLFNLAVVMGAAPAKGVPMPLLSYGGSNLIVSLAAVGLLLNCSRSMTEGGRA